MLGRDRAGSPGCSHLGGSGNAQSVAPRSPIAGFAAVLEFTRAGAGFAARGRVGLNGGVLMVVIGGVLLYTASRFPPPIGLPPEGSS